MGILCPYFRPRIFFGGANYYCLFLPLCCCMGLTAEEGLWQWQLSAPFTGTCWCSGFPPALRLLTLLEAKAAEDDEDEGAAVADEGLPPPPLLKVTVLAMAWHCEEEDILVCEAAEAMSTAAWFW